MKFKTIIISLLLIIFLLAGCTHSKQYVKESNNFGIKSAKKGYWREAKFRWEKLLKENPQDYIAMNNLAVCLEAEGEFEKAIELYTQALELQPRNKYIKLNLERAQKVLEEKQRKSKPIEE